MPGTYAILVVSIFPSREFVYYMLLFVCFSGKKKKKNSNSPSFNAYMLQNS